MRSRLWSLLLVGGVATTGLATAVPLPAAAVTGPTVTLVSPSSGSVVRGTTQLVARVTSGAAVHVVFSVDDWSSPVLDVYQSAGGTYAVDWDSTGWSEGPHRVTAHAVDSFDVSGPETAAANFVVDNCGSTARVYEPATGSALSGVVTISGAANFEPTWCPGNYSSGLDFYVDGVRASFVETISDDGLYRWAWDTRRYANGTHTISVAGDDGNPGAMSQSIQVATRNVAPTARVTAPAAGAKVSGTAVGIAASAAADAAGGKTVSSVAFYVDGKYVNTDYIAPYQVSWNTTTASDGTHAVTARATDSGGMSTSSAPVSVVVTSPTTLTLGVPAGTITYGSSETLTATLKRLQPVAGAGVAGKLVTLYSRKHGASTWAAVATRTTSTSGVAAFTIKPLVNTEYYARFAGATGYAAKASSSRTVYVRPQLTARFSKTSIPLGGTTSLSGGVYPNHAGNYVYLQSYYSGAWHTVLSAKLSSTSIYVFHLRGTSRGTSYSRVYKPADADHAATVTGSRTARVY